MKHGGVSVFAGVGERTREGNDLWLEMKESGVITPGNPEKSKAALLYGPRTQPPGPRRRPGRPAAGGPPASGRRLPAEPGDGDGRAAGADHLHEEGLHHLGPGDL